MGKKFCNSCGAELSDEVKFCEQCGSEVAPDVSDIAPVSPSQPPAGSQPSLQVFPALAGAGRKKSQVLLLAGIVVILVIAAAIVFLVLPHYGGSHGAAGSSSAVSGTSPLPAGSIMETPGLPVTTPAPTTPASLYPDALKLKQPLTFGSGDVISECTVYRYWINDSYQWHNNFDNHYYTQKADDGYKFLFIFIDMANNGKNRVWPPTTDNIHLLYGGTEYPIYAGHSLPVKSIENEVSITKITEMQYRPPSPDQNMLKISGIRMERSMRSFTPSRATLSTGT